MTTDKTNNQTDQQDASKDDEDGNTAFTLSPTGLLLFRKGKMQTIPKTHVNFSLIKDAILNEQYDNLDDLIGGSSKAAEWLKEANPRFKVEAGAVYLDDDPFTKEVSDKVISMLSGGWPATPIINFLIRTRENPSYAAQTELLLFCVANNFLITEDGHILAFKSVRHDYKDCHTGTNDNKPGAEVSMPRNQVDDDRNTSCSRGLHFGSFKYAKGFSGTRVMMVKVDPADVVSIPRDYNNQKGRCCRYVVISEIDPNKGDTIQSKEVVSDQDVAAVSK